MSSQNKTLQKQQYLFSILLGPASWTILEFAFSHHLFDHLMNPQTATEISDELGWLPEQVELLLNSYVALKIMDKTTSSFIVKSDYQSLLNSQSPTYIGDTLCYLMQIRTFSTDNIQQWLTGSEQTFHRTNMLDPQFWHNATQQLQIFHRTIRNPVVLPLLEALPEWHDGQKMLDVGAGSAELAKDIKNKHPRSQITLFDLAPCCHAIKNQLPDDQQTIVLRPGDMNDGDFGGPYHIILASMSLYYANDLPKCLENLWNALTPGGVLISFHEALGADRTTPLAHILGRLPIELSHGRLSLEPGQMETNMIALNPLKLESHLIPTAFGEMEWIAAHKA
jgi:SAM-dependent methyltransferase